MILVIDDDCYYTDSMARMLSTLGYAVKTAKSVDIALNELQEHGNTVQIVILDIMMRPGEKISQVQSKGGFETGYIVAALIREAFPKIKIICSSAMDIDREKWSGLFDFVLRKPLLGSDQLDSILKLIYTKSEKEVAAIDAFKLAPSLFGIGIDLKELAKWLRKKTPNK